MPPKGPKPPKPPVPVARANDVLQPLLANYFRIETGTRQDLYSYPLRDIRVLDVDPKRACPPSNVTPANAVKKNPGKSKQSDFRPTECWKPGCPCAVKLPEPSPEVDTARSQNSRKGSGQGVKSQGEIGESQKGVNGAREPNASKKSDELGAPDEPGTPNATQPARRTPPRMMRRIVYLLIQAIRAHHKEPIAIASDYATHLVTTQRILSDDVPGHWNVTYYDEDEAGPRPNALRYHVEIRAPNVLSLPALQDYLADPGRFWDAQGNQLYHDRDETLNALNLIFSHRPCQDRVRSPPQDPTVTNIGLNKFYDMQGGSLSWVIQDNPELEAKPGFFRSVRAPIKGQLLLNINTTTGAFYQSINLKALMNLFGNDRGLRTDVRSLRTYEGFIKGIRVKTNYMRRSAMAAGMSSADAALVRERIFTITGLPFTHNPPEPGNVFFTEDGRSTQAADTSSNATHDTSTAKSSPPRTTQPAVAPNRTSVGQYFTREHGGITLATSNPPCWVVSLGQKPIFVPAELLDVLPGQNFKQKTKMAEGACHEPRVNATLINNDGMRVFGLLANPGPNDPASAFGISIQANMVQVKPVILQPPQVAYDVDRPRKVLDEDDLRRGSWNMSKKRFVVPSTGKWWTYVELIRPRTGTNPQGTDDHLLQTFEDGFRDGMSQYGITGCRLAGLTHFADHRIALRSRPKQHADDPDGDEDKDSEAIEAAINRIQTQANQREAKDAIINLDLVVVLLPTKDVGTYSMVKRLFDQKMGLHSICHVVAETDKKKYYGPKTDFNFFANLYMKLNLKLSPLGANQVLHVKPAALDDGNTMIMGMDVTHPGAGALSGSPSVAAVVASMDVNFSQWPAALRVNPGPKESMEEIVHLEEMVCELLEMYQTRRERLPTTIVVYRDGLAEEQLIRTCLDVEFPRIKQAIFQTYPANLRPRVVLICTVKRHHTRFYPPASVQRPTPLVDENGNPRPGCVVDNTVTKGNGLDFFLTHALCYVFGRATRSVGLATPAYYADLAADRARCYVRRTYAPTGRGPLDNIEYDPNFFELALHPNVEGSMFYI